MIKEGRKTPDGQSNSYIENYLTATWITIKRQTNKQQYRIKATVVYRCSKFIIRLRENRSGLQTKIGKQQKLDL